jgi:hypothetical protein
MVRADRSSAHATMDAVNPVINDCVPRMSMDAPRECGPLSPEKAVPSADRSARRYSILSGIVLTHEASEMGGTGRSVPTNLLEFMN